MFSPRLFLSLCLALVLLAAPATALADADYATRIGQLEEQIKLLQEQISALKDAVPQATAQSAPAPAPAEGDYATKEDVAKVKKTVGTVYKKVLDVQSSILDKVEIGANLDSQMFWVDRENNDTETEQSNPQLGTHRLELKLKAMISDELKFNTTLAMYKLWGADQFEQYPYSRDLNEGFTPGDSSVYVTKAYFDYRPDWLDQRVNLEVGRLPTTGGLASMFRYDTPRVGGYPDLAFNGVADGAALSIYFDDVLPLPNPKLSFVWSKLTSDKGTPFAVDEPDLMDSTFLATQFESGIPGLENSLLMLNHVWAMDVQTPDSDAVGLPAASLPEQLGDMHKFTLHLQAENIADSGLDAFVSGSLLFSDPQNDPAQFAVPGLPVTIPVGLLSDDQEAHSAQAFYAGLRYTLPFETIPGEQPKIGAEFNWGSEYWAGYNYASTEPVSKLDVRGKAFEIYFIQPVNDYLRFRIGYQHIQQDYTGGDSIYGAPDEVDITHRVFYAGALLSF